MKVQVILAVCCLLPMLVAGFRTQAGTDACLDFTPRHNNTTPQAGTPPYTLTVDVTTVAASGNVRVTLTATGSMMFRGFLVQARCTSCSTANTAIVSGTFTQMATSDPTQAIPCPGGNMNSMTHTNNADKQTVSFTWTAPSTVDTSQGIEFRAVVVKTFPEWWSNVRSTEVMLTSAAASTVPFTGLLLGTVVALLTRQ